MAKENAAFLDTNDAFPEMDLKLVSGRTLSLPEATGKGYGVVLFYRGSW
jgi:peroxiredoxin